MKEEHWVLFEDQSYNAAENMAIDALIFDHFKSPVLRFYNWNKDAISIGVSQRYEKTKREGFELVRRQTGGGIVDHSNSFTYTIVFPANHEMVKKETLISYQKINEAVKNAIVAMDFTVDLTDVEIAKDIPRDAMPCAAHPTKYDIVQNSSKISGCAQRRTQSGILHQGYISDLVGDEGQLRKLIIKEIGKAFNCTWSKLDKWESFDSDLEKLVETQYGNETWSKRR
ncbi:MAG: lipoate--protein ligase family protein [Lentisphaeria bacterium]|nr:lipoate--protein ligase family protein [Lentisphaeria bacterium]